MGVTHQLLAALWLVPLSYLNGSFESSQILAGLLLLEANAWVRRE